MLLNLNKYVEHNILIHNIKYNMTQSNNLQLIN